MEANFGSCKTEPLVLMSGHNLSRSYTQDSRPGRCWAADHCFRDQPFRLFGLLLSRPAVIPGIASNGWQAEHLQTTKYGLVCCQALWYVRSSQGVFRAWPRSATISAVERTSENRAITLISVALCSSSLRAALASETMTHL